MLGTPQKNFGALMSRVLEKKKIELILEFFSKQVNDQRKGFVSSGLLTSRR